MDIFAELHNEHEKVAALMASLKASGADENTLSTLKSELTSHAEAEERVFYKRLENEEKTKDVVAEGYEEHKHIARALGALTPTLGPTFPVALAELKEIVDHHVEEEAGALFEEARSVLSEDEAESLYEAFEKAKGELQS